jgi:uncharacterized integral membrane protein
MKLQIVFTLSIIILVLIFAVQNSAIVKVQLLFWHVDMPLSLLIFAMILVGVVIGWFIKPMFRIKRD